MAVADRSEAAKLRLRGGLLTFALLLAGCSGSPESSTGDADNLLRDFDLSIVSEAQAEELSDREVTADEYHAAFQRYRGCLSAAGFELRDLEFKGKVYEFGVPGDAVEDGVDTECYLSEFKYVDMIWQTSDDIQNNSETARFYRDCLQRNGIEPAETLEEMSKQLKDAGIKPPDCL